MTYTKWLWVMLSLFFQSLPKRRGVQTCPYTYCIAIKYYIKSVADFYY